MVTGWLRGESDLLAADFDLELGAGSVDADDGNDDRERLVNINLSVVVKHDLVVPALDDMALRAPGALLSNGWRWVDGVGDGRGYCLGEDGGRDGLAAELLLVGDDGLGDDRLVYAGDGNGRGGGQDGDSRDVYLVLVVGSRQAGEVRDVDGHIVMRELILDDCPRLGEMMVMVVILVLLPFSRTRHGDSGRALMLPCESRCPLVDGVLANDTRPGETGGGSMRWRTCDGLMDHRGTGNNGERGLTAEEWLVLLLKLERNIKCGIEVVVRLWPVMIGEDEGRQERKSEG